MNEKFTLGKWQANTETGCIYSEEVSCTIGKVAALMNNPEEYKANLRLLSNAKVLYFTLKLARPFVPEDISIRADIDRVLRKINPNFDKRAEVTDIKKFAERVKNMRDWQRAKEVPQPFDIDRERYVKGSEDLIDSIVAEILQEA